MKTPSLSSASSNNKKHMFLVDHSHTHCKIAIPLYRQQIYFGSAFCHHIIVLLSYHVNQPEKKLKIQPAMVKQFISIIFYICTIRISNTMYE